MAGRFDPTTPAPLMGIDPDPIAAGTNRADLVDVPFQIRWCGDLSNDRLEVEDDDSSAKTRRWLSWRWTRVFCAREPVAPSALDQACAKPMERGDHLVWPNSPSAGSRERLDQFIESRPWVFLDQPFDLTQRAPHCPPSRLPGEPAMQQPFGLLADQDLDQPEAVATRNGISAGLS